MGASANAFFEVLIGVGHTFWGCANQDIDYLCAFLADHSANACYEAHIFAAACLAIVAAFAGKFKGCAHCYYLPVFFYTGLKYC